MVLVILGIDLFLVHPYAGWTVTVASVMLVFGSAISTYAAWVGKGDWEIVGIWLVFAGLGGTVVNGFSFSWGPLRAIAVAALVVSLIFTSVRMVTLKRIQRFGQPTSPRSSF